MGASKNLLALYVDGLELSALFCRFGKQRIQIRRIDKHNLVERLRETSDVLPDLEAGGGPVISAEDIFGENDKKLTTALENTTPATMESTGPAAQSNEEVIQSVFRSVPAKHFYCAVNLPAAISQSVQLRNGYGKLKKSARRRKIAADIGERLNKPIGNDQFDFFLNDNNNVFAFAYSGQIPLLNLYDTVQTSLKRRYRLVSVLPDEVALLNLIRLNYSPGEDEVLIIVNISLEVSKIIITRGGRITQIAPPISDDSSSGQLLKTITGKILYEQSLGNIPEHYRVVLTGKSRQLDAAPFFLRALETTDVTYFTANPEIFHYDPEIEAGLSEMAVPLGQIATVFLANDKRIIPLSLVPDYINRRQRVLKLAWHGYLLLLLIFLVPLWINQQYAAKSKMAATFHQKKNQLDKAISDLKWVEGRLDSLVIQNKLSKQKLDLLETLSSGTHKWSFTLDKIVQSINNVNGELWLTEINTQGAGVQLSGVSLYRNRPPRLAAQFPQASVDNVTPVDIRGRTVYQFRITIDKITEDEKNFNPVVKIPVAMRGKMEEQPTISETEKPAVLFQKGLKAFNQQDIDEALRLFETLAARPEAARYASEARVWIGRCYFMKGNYAQAITNLQAFIDENPQNPERLNAMLFLGKSYAASQKSKEARAIFLTVMKESPTSEIGLEAAQLVNTLQ